TSTSVHTNSTSILTVQHSIFNRSEGSSSYLTNLTDAPTTNTRSDNFSSSSSHNFVAQVHLAPNKRH
ncbi:hypothetical protein A2U01_0061675, partial [Trifolium medium]|nr:hypothetical protein [Trifolium medium]